MRFHHRTKDLQFTVGKHATNSRYDVYDTTLEQNRVTGLLNRTICLIPLYSHFISRFPGIPMAPLEAEWLLWAKQLRGEHKILLQRIDAATQAAARIQPLVEQTKDLATSSEHLQAENNVLKERILTLGEESADREKAMAKEMGGLRGRINELEKELDVVVADVTAWREEWARIVDEENGKRDRGRSASRTPAMVLCAVDPVEDRAGEQSIFVKNLMHSHPVLHALQPTPQKLRAMLCLTDSFFHPQLQGPYLKPQQPIQASIRSLPREITFKPSSQASSSSSSSNMPLASRLRETRRWRITSGTARRRYGGRFACTRRAR